MTTKLSADQSKKASQILGRLDKVATHIMDNHAKWGMPFEAARDLVNNLDKTADEIETLTFGEDSLARRQAEVLKSAKVHQKDSDEGYMSTFENPMKPHQTESDEPYMQAYADDQSSAVLKGKASDGRPLTGK